MLCGSVLTASLRADDAHSEWQLDAARARGYLVKLCRIGPRPSGSRGMERQQKLIVEHFRSLGAEIRFQTFDSAHPLSGAPVRMNNIVVSWHPQSEHRVLLACHYDTRPFPDQDRRNPRGRFIGANDGASGVALLMELGHHLPAAMDGSARKRGHRGAPTEGWSRGPALPVSETSYGVDFVFFDAEEFMFGNRGKYFLGSEHFARTYRDQPPAYRYDYGVVVDMVADRRLTLYKEKNSVKHAPELTNAIWATARRLNVREFVDREKHEVLDDHLPLNEIAGIPTCDVIDFDYPYWHTTQDLPSKCSGESLAKVGRVLLVWLSEL